MYSNVDTWCKTCELCAKRKTPRNKLTAPLHSIPVDRPFDRVGVDVLGPFVESA